MLGLKHARREVIDRAPGSTATSGLRHDRPRIHLGPHEIHGAAGDLHAFIQNASMGMQAS